MITLNFQKYFIKGLLRGKKVNDSISFPNTSDAKKWIDSILRKEQSRKLDYILMNFTD